MESKYKLKIGADSLYLYALILFLCWRILFLGVNWYGSLMWAADKIARLSELAVYFLLLLVYVKDFLKHPGIRHGLMLPVMLCMYLSYRNTRDNELIFMAAFVMLSYVVSFERISRVYLSTGAICLATLITACLLGLVKEARVYFSYGYSRSLGMAHPNNLAALVLNLLMLWGYRNIRKKRHGLVAAVSVVAGLLIWEIAKSRTTFILILGFGVLVLILRFMELSKTTRWLKILKLSTVGVLAITAVLTTYWYRFTGSILQDENMAVRFRSGYELTKQYGLHLFGSRIEFIGVQKAWELGVPAVVLDTAYLNLPISHGIIPTVLFFALIVLLYRRLGKERNYALIMITTVFLVAGLMEKGVFMIMYDFALLAVFAGRKLYPGVKEKRALL